MILPQSHGVNVVTNFDIRRYNVEKITTSTTLLVGEFVKRNTELEPNNEVVDHNKQVFDLIFQGLSHIFVSFELLVIW